MMYFFPKMSFLKMATIFTAVMLAVGGYMIYWMEVNGL